MKETIKTSLPFNANDQFSASYKGDVISVHGEITKEDLSNFVETHLQDIIEILDDVKEKNKLEEYRLSLVWHNSQEEPEIKKTFVYKGADGSCEADYLHRKLNWKEYASIYGISRWAYVEDLLPDKQKKQQ